MKYKFEAVTKKIARNNLIKFYLFYIIIFPSVPISPTTTEWFWSNATHIYIQLSGWEDNGCEITKWEVDYREYGGKVWRRAENKLVIIKSVKLTKKIKYRINLKTTQILYRNFVISYKINFGLINNKFY